MNKDKPTLACCECEQTFHSNEELHAHLVQTGHSNPRDN